MSNPMAMMQAWMKMWSAPFAGGRGPLSGDVIQDINPWTELMKNGMFGLVNVHLGNSRNPETERAVEKEFGGNFDQLMIIADALEVLIRNVDVRTLSERDALAVLDFKRLMHKVDVVEYHTDFGSPPPEGFGAGGFSDQPPKTENSQR